MTTCEHPTCTRPADTACVAVMGNGAGETREITMNLCDFHADELRAHTEARGNTVVNDQRDALPQSGRFKILDEPIPLIDNAVLALAGWRATMDKGD